MRNGHSVQSVVRGITVTAITNSQAASGGRRGSAGLLRRHGSPGHPEAEDYRDRYKQQNEEDDQNDLNWVDARSSIERS